MSLWLIVQEKYTEANPTHPNERHRLEVDQNAQYSDSRRTSDIVEVGRRKTEWCDADSMDERQVADMRRHHTRHSQTRTLATPRREQQLWLTERQQTKRQNKPNYVPIAVETDGAWHDMALKFITEMERTIAVVTRNPRKTIPLPLVVRFFVEWECCLIQEHLLYPACNCLTLGALLLRKTKIKNSQAYKRSAGGRRNKRNFIIRRNLDKSMLNGNVRHYELHNSESNGKSIAF